MLIPLPPIYWAPKHHLDVLSTTSTCARFAIVACRRRVSYAFRIFIKATDAFGSRHLSGCIRTDSFLNVSWITFWPALLVSCIYDKRKIR